MTDRSMTPRPACLGASHVFDALIDHESGPVAKSARTVAMSLCASCPIREACWTENATEPWLLRLTGRKLPPTERVTCGKPHGAEAHRRANEAACERCKSADVQRVTRKKQRRKPIKHGTNSGYMIHMREEGMACEDCREAHRAADRERTARRRAAKEAAA